MKLKKSTRSILLFVIILCAVLLIASLLSSANKPEEIDYSKLLDEIESQNVEAISIEGYYSVRVLYKNSASGYTIDDFPKNADATVNITDRESLVTRIHEIEDAKIEAGLSWDKPTIILDNPSKGNFLSTWMPIIVLIVLGFLLFYMFKQSQKGNNKAMDFGKTKARENTNIKVRFTDVAGAVEEKEELMEIVDFLKSPKKFIDVGARIPKGVLLVGPPGTGKTLFAKAVSGEANVPFFSISGSDFVEMFVGVGASRVRDMFNQAKKNMPCIIFIDEIDAVGRKRGAGLGGGHDEREQTLNQLLVQMDGFETNEGVIILAATNRIDILDPALLRPGRFDRQIVVNIPDVKGREAIFRVHARNKPIASDIEFKVLARMTSGFTGADIENLLNEAAILAARANRKIIVMTDVLEGINKVIVGPQKKSRIVTDSDKRITAYHEAGHAIIAKQLKGCDDVQEVSIIPRGMAAGYTLTRPDRDDNHISKSKLIDLITMMLGGRAAEELVIHDISTGASNDIQRATSIARSMVGEWGMSSLGNIYLGGDTEVFLGRDYGQMHKYSEHLAGKVDEEIKKIIDNTYEEAKKILSENRKTLDSMVKLLFKEETIYAEEVDMLFKGKSLDDISKHIEERYKKAQEREKEAYNELVVKEKDYVNSKNTKDEKPDRMQKLQEDLHNKLQDGGISVKDANKKKKLEKKEEDKPSAKDNGNDDEPKS